jgi:hypothetical protein
VLDHQLQQAGFAAAADAGNNLYRFRVLETNQLFQVPIPVLEFM